MSRFVRILLAVAIALSVPAVSVTAHSYTCGSNTDVQVRLYDNDDLTGLLASYCVPDSMGYHWFVELAESDKNKVESVAITSAGDPADDGWCIDFVDGNTAGSTHLWRTHVIRSWDYHANPTSSLDNRANGFDVLIRGYSDCDF